MSAAVASTNTPGTRSVTLAELRVCDLKLELEKRGLDKAGVKFSLVERLEAALREEGHDPEAFLFTVGDAGKASVVSPRSSSRISAATGPGGVASGESTKAAVEEEEHEETDGEEERGAEVPTKRRKVASEGIDDSADDEEHTSQPAEEPSIVESVRSGGESAKAEGAAAVENQKKGGGDEKESAASEAKVEVSAEAEPAKKEGDDKKKDNGVKPEDPKEAKGPAKEATTDGEHQQSQQQPVVVAQKAQLGTLSRADASLWVKGIGNNTRATDLKAMCMKHGKVITAKIFTRRGQAKSTCFGFVTMASVSAADECIREFNGSTFMGHSIVVEKVDQSCMPPVRAAPKKPAEKPSEKSPAKSAAAESGAGKTAPGDGAAHTDEEESAKESADAQKTDTSKDAEKAEGDKASKTSAASDKEKRSSSIASKSKKSPVVAPSSVKSEKTDHKRSTVSTTRTTSYVHKGNGAVRSGDTGFRRPITFRGGVRKPFSTISGGVRRGMIVGSRGRGMFSTRSRGFSSMSTRGYQSRMPLGRGSYGRGGTFISRGGFSGRIGGMRGSLSNRYERHQSPPRFDRSGGMRGDMPPSRRMMMDTGPTDRAGVWSSSSRREMLEAMRRKDEEFRIKEEGLKLQRERERLRYERERIERERVELEQLRMTALAVPQVQPATHMYSSSRRSNEMYSGVDSSSLHRSAERGGGGLSSRHSGADALIQGGRYERRETHTSRRDDEPRRESVGGRRSPPVRPGGDRLGGDRDRSRSKRGGMREAHTFMSSSSVGREPRTYASASSRDLGSSHSRVVHSSSYGRSSDQGTGGGYSSSSFGRETFRSPETAGGYSSSRRVSESIGRGSRSGAAGYGSSSGGYGRDSGSLGKEVVSHTHGRYSGGSGSRGMAASDATNPWSSMSMAAAEPEYIGGGGTSSTSGYNSGSVWSSQSMAAGDMFESRDVSWSGGGNSGSGGYGSVGYEKTSSSKYEYDKYGRRY